MMRVSILSQASCRTSRDSDIAGVITATIRDFSRISGLGRTSIYQLIDAGDLQSVKIGKRRLVIVASYLDLLKRGGSAKGA